MPQFVNWVRLYDIDKPWKVMKLARAHDKMPIPFYYATLAGMLPVVQSSIESNVDINERYGVHGSALLVASSKGHERIMELLLQHGAHVNAPGGQYHDTALQQASFRGHERVVELLLQHSADVDAA